MLYFNASSDTLGDALFELTAGSSTPTPVDPTGSVLSHLSGDDSAFHEFDGSLYFNEASVALSDDTLFKLDTSGTLTPLTFNNKTADEALQGAGEFGGFTDFAGSTYFVATTQSEGTQLFKLDAAGITEITDVSGGAFDANLVSGFVQYAGSVFFDAYNSTGGDDPYKLDANGTLTAIEPGILSGAGVNGGFQVFGGNLYFYANDSSYLHAQLIALDDNTTNGITFQAYDVNLGEGTNSFTSTPTVFGVGPPCFARGTRILTDCGAVAVERLEVGHRLVTASGGLRPIQWLGHRAFDDCRRHPNPRAVWPVRVSAGAFGDAQPSRDLWLSPDHSVAVEGALIPIRFLINGRSIAQVETATVEYWHVELDEHDILIAEGLTAESYLDTGNRGAFLNGGAFIEAHPEFEPKHWRETCLPLLAKRSEIAPAKARVLARLFEQGHELTREADAYVVADGQRIDPIRLSETRLAFALPAGCEAVVLKSNTFIPAHALAESKDERELGLCVARLQVDGDEVALEDATLSAPGWHGPERKDGRFQRRWTRGEVSLPAGARLALIDLAGLGHYWRVPAEALARVA